MASAKSGGTSESRLQREARVTTNRLSNMTSTRAGRTYARRTRATAVGAGRG